MKEKEDKQEKEGENEKKGERVRMKKVGEGEERRRK